MTNYNYLLCGVFVIRLNSNYQKLTYVLSRAYKCTLISRVNCHVKHKTGNTVKRGALLVRGVQQATLSTSLSHYERHVHNIFMSDHLVLCDFSKGIGV